MHVLMHHAQSVIQLLLGFSIAPSGGCRAVAGSSLLGTRQMDWMYIRSNLFFYVLSLNSSLPQAESRSCKNLLLNSAPSPGGVLGIATSILATRQEAK